MAKKYEMDMCSGSILKKMLLFAFPLMLSNMLQLLFNAADIIVVGRFAGDNALAAVGSNTSLINLLTNVFIGLSIGTNVLVSRYFGAKDKDNLQKTVHTSLMISLICGVVLTAIGEIFARQLLELMKSPEDVIDLAAVYLRIYFLGMPAMMLYNFGSAILRAIGDTKRPLYYLLGAGVINVLLNLLLVLVFHLGVAGVAIATIISQIISSLLIIRCLMKEKGDYRFIPKLLKIDGGKLKEIMRIGLPAGFQGTIFSLSNVVIQSSINSFGAVVVAGNSAAASLEGFVYFAMNAFHHSTLTFTSQNLGARQYKRISRVLLTGLACVTAAGFIAGYIVVLAGRPLLGIYTKNPAAIDAGMQRIWVVCGTYALCGLMDVMVGGIRGLGYAIMPMIVSLIGACGLRLVWLATVFQIPQYHTTETIYMSYPVSWGITVLAHIICYIIIRKKHPFPVETEEKK